MHRTNMGAMGKRVIREQEWVPVGEKRWFIKLKNK